MTYSSHHKEYNDDERRDRRIRYSKDDLRDLKVKAMEFDGNLNLATLIGLNPWKACLSSEAIIIRSASYFLFLRCKGMHPYGLKT